MAVNVLIVEDQDIPRELFEIYIKSSERFHHLLSISSASAALSVCKSNQVDLILMDVMTELDRSGLDAAEEIKSLAAISAFVSPVVSSFSTSSSRSVNS